jgi:hypothetical protein
LIVMFIFFYFVQVKVRHCFPAKRVPPGGFGASVMGTEKRTSQCIHIPFRTSHSPSCAWLPTTTRFWPQVVQYFTRKLTVVRTSGGAVAIAAGFPESGKSLGKSRRAGGALIANPKRVVAVRRTPHRRNDKFGEPVATIDPRKNKRACALEEPRERKCSFFDCDSPKHQEEERSISTGA